MMDGKLNERGKSIILDKLIAQSVAIRVPVFIINKECRSGRSLFLFDTFIILLQLRYKSTKSAAFWLPCMVLNKIMYYNGDARIYIFYFRA